MKKALLFAVLLTAHLIFAQTPISDFFSVPNSNYAIVTDAELDQSLAGANVTWNFTNFTAVGMNTDTYASPTASELAAYPGTTEVLIITADNKVFAKDIASTFSVTGAGALDVDLNYINDNALIGTFPLNYNYDNTDNVEGTFSAMGVNGTFSGTIQATVDAYGTLNINDVGEGAYSGNVTRLKTIQNIDLSISGLPFPVGVATQISHYYYDNSTNNLVFRSNTITVSAPLAGIDQTTTLLESFLEITLSSNEVELTSNDLQIFPNPVEETMVIKLNNTADVKAMFVTDLNGRIIISRNSFQENIETNILQSGMYILSIETQAGVMTKKFLKK